MGEVPEVILNRWIAGWMVYSGGKSEIRELMIYVAPPTIGI